MRYIQEKETLGVAALRSGMDEKPGRMEAESQTRSVVRPALVWLLKNQEDRWLINTGQVLRPITRSVTLPMSRRVNPFLPWEPMMIRVAGSFAAAARIASCGSPSMTTGVNLTPCSSARCLTPSSISLD